MQFQLSRLVSVKISECQVSSRPINLLPRTSQTPRLTLTTSNSLTSNPLKRMPQNINKTALQTPSKPTFSNLYFLSQFSTFFVYTHQLQYVHNIQFKSNKKLFTMLNIINILSLL